MDEENTLDFKALRAKFQDEELLLKQVPKTKPVLPDKPKVVPPPTSPTHYYIPSGARPSLLTSINNNLESKTPIAPRVVFKDEKKESKKPLLQINSKPKDTKVKVGKDKSKGSKERLYDEPPEQKPKKETKEKKETTATLVPATPPPKNTTLKKKGFLGFKKSKRDSLDITAEPILDIPSSDMSGPVPLIPVPHLPNQKPSTLTPKALMPNIPISSAVEVTTPPTSPVFTPPSTFNPNVPAPPNFNPPPTFIPEIPASPAFTPPSTFISEVPALPDFNTPSTFIPEVPAPPDFTTFISEVPAPPDFTTFISEVPASPDFTSLFSEVPAPPDFTSIFSEVPASPDITLPPTFIPQVPASPEPLTLDSETPTVIETLSVSQPSSQNYITPRLTSTLITPELDGSALEGGPIPSTQLPVPETAAAGPIDIASLAIPQPPEIPPSTKAERPISALSFLERAEDICPVKKTTPGDQRIFNALEKARKMAQSHQKPSISPMTPPPEEHPIPEGETGPLLDLQPTEYDRMRKALPSKPELVNGLDHRSSLVLEGTAEEPNGIPELLVVPPPPPRRVLPELNSLGPLPPKSLRPLSTNLSAFSPPPSLEGNAVAIPAPPEFSETDTDVGAQTDVLEFHDVTSDANSPERPVSEWGNGDYNGSDIPDGSQLPERYSDGMILAAAEVSASPVFEEGHQENPEYPNNRDSLIPGAQVDSFNPYEGTDNVYEDVTTSASKKKKTDVKKRKGPPKNPYAETPETTEVKTRTGRFSKSDKKEKAAAEGPDEKDLKKKEKQRLEKEKKELKEKQEREKREQKEREKKESEMKKKFKITGQEDAMYQAKVTVTTKGRKNDLPVTSGDNISIIRTTNCPKGKWLARDSSNNYGYVAVDHVELDIKEMLELGKRATVPRKSSRNVTEPEIPSSGVRASNPFPLTESFTDDSEEWTCDDDETLSPVEPTDPQAPLGHSRTLSMPDIGNRDVSVNHQHSQSDLVDTGHLQARHEALQKLATFFHAPQPVEPTASADEPETGPGVIEEDEAAAVPEASRTQETEFETPETILLPPPELYADVTVE